MKKTLATFIFLLTSFFSAARDFKEPPAVFDPLSYQREDAFLLNYGYGDIKINIHSFKGSEYDNSDIRALCAFNLVSLESLFAINLYWSVYLLIGPVAPSETPATIAAFWMNAAQYEYGLTAAFNLAGMHILLEYSRTSQHPVAGREMYYSEVTTDVLKTGVVVPPIKWQEFSVQTYFRTGYVDLLDFWQSSVPKPRALWIFSPSVSAYYSINEFVSVFFQCEPDLLILRQGGTDIDLVTETGFEFGSGSTKLRLYLEYFHTGDTEEVLGIVWPTDFLGWGVHFYTIGLN